MKQIPKSFAITVLLVVICLAPAQVAAPSRIPIEAYIANTWDVLTRSHRELAQAAIDPKSPPLADGRWPVYISRRESLSKVREQLMREMAPGTFSKIELRILPANGLAAQPGLLYLPYPYAVPGGRFNEMYGWDSYFIVLGLLHDGKIELAKNMVDNFLYEIHYYGKILNANRTYYLTRSQPPFLSEMLLEVYRATHDKAWLLAALPALIETHRFWTTGPHLTPETSLSRYFDFGSGPAPEVLSSEKDEHGRNHYELIKDYYREHDVDDYDLTQYLDRAHDQLKPLFYKGDRSMRESGFDPSNRFGPFNIDIVHYNPVCLNSLLYLMEAQTAEILATLGRGSEAKPWLDQAGLRAERINKLNWDERDGLYYDYNFERHKVRRYPFLTTFFPLWAGIATKEQAVRVLANLPKFEQPGGLETSTFVSGNQWDAPYAWAPLQMIAVEGMRRYGFNSDADRVTHEFLSLVDEAYRQDGVIVEKYDSVRRATSVSGSIRFGYRTNEPGFGWTNAVYTRLSGELTDQRK
jgi:alpha,alpha-trehalase